MGDTFPLAVFAPDQPLAIRYSAGAATPLKHIGSGYTFKRKVTLGNGDLLCIGKVGAHQVCSILGVLTQYVKGIVVSCLGDLLEFGLMVIAVHGGLFAEFQGSR